jgi:hypothetical protein
MSGRWFSMIYRVSRGIPQKLRKNWKTMPPDGGISPKIVKADI